MREWAETTSFPLDRKMVLSYAAQFTEIAEEIDGACRMSDRRRLERAFGWAGTKAAPFVLSSSLSGIVGAHVGAAVIEPPAVVVECAHDLVQALDEAVASLESGLLPRESEGDVVVTAGLAEATGTAHDATIHTRSTPPVELSASLSASLTTTANGTAKRPGDERPLSDGPTEDPNNDLDRAASASGESEPVPQPTSWYDMKDVENDRREDVADGGTGDRPPHNDEADRLEGDGGHLAERVKDLERSRLREEERRAAAELQRATAPGGQQDLHLLGEPIPDF